MLACYNHWGVKINSYNKGNGYASAITTLQIYLSSIYE